MEVRDLVYIDNYEAPFQNMIMCHLIADSNQELLEFVDKINVNRKWIQHVGKYSEHFDICLSKKKLAIRFGAIEISPKELVGKMREKKEK